MRQLRSLTSLVLVGSLALGASGCDKQEYYFSGKIGEENVIFYEDMIGAELLEVTRTDGTQVTYFQKIFDESLSYVTIEKEGVEYVYSSIAFDGEVIDIAQTQYDDYLEKILEIKKEEALRNIKGE